MGLLTSHVKEDGSFEPSRLYYWLKPAVSGNTINGLNETEVRRPSPVYHYVKIKHPWRRWQNTFYFRVSLSLRYLRQFARTAMLKLSSPGKVEQMRSEETPEQLTAGLKAFLLDQGASDVAVARMQPEWVMEDMDLTEPFVVTFAMAMDHDTIMRMDENGGDVIAGAHMIKKYNEGTKIAQKGADWLRERGYESYGYSGPASGKFTSIPAAIAGGLGELGKHGSMIHPKLGSNFRIGYILTNALLVPGQPQTFGADDFCTNCQVCSKHCPPDAIYPEKQTVRGQRKWYVDFDKCISFFNEAYGCGICIAVCPWSRPGVADKLVVKMARRANRLAKSQNNTSSL